MNTEIGFYEAKTRFLELLRAVRKGQSFTITERGEAVAELGPVNHAHQESARAAKRMVAFMHEHHLRGVNIKALIEECRR